MKLSNSDFPQVTKDEKCEQEISWVFATKCYSSINLFSSSSQCVVYFEILSSSSVNPLRNIQTNDHDHSNKPTSALAPNKQTIMFSNMKVTKFAARWKQWLLLILMSLIKSRYMLWYCWTIVAKQMIRIIFREKTEKAIGKNPVLNDSTVDVNDNGILRGKAVAISCAW